MYLQPQTGRGGPGETEHTGPILWTWRRDSEREQNITTSQGSMSNWILNSRFLHNLRSHVFVTVPSLPEIVVWRAGESEQTYCLLWASPRQSSLPCHATSPGTPPIYKITLSLYCLIIYLKFLQFYI